MGRIKAEALVEVASPTGSRPAAFPGTLRGLGLGGLACVRRARRSGERARCRPSPRHGRPSCRRRQGERGPGRTRRPFVSGRRRRFPRGGIQCGAGALPQEIVRRQSGIGGRAWIFFRVRMGRPGTDRHVAYGKRAAGFSDNGQKHLKLRSHPSSATVATAPPGARGALKKKGRRRPGLLPPRFDAPRASAVGFPRAASRARAGRAGTGPARQARPSSQ